MISRSEGWIPAWEQISQKILPVSPERSLPVTRSVLPGNSVITTSLVIAWLPGQSSIRKTEKDILPYALGLGGGQVHLP